MEHIRATAKKILKYLCKNPEGASRKEIASVIGISYSAIVQHVANLAEKELTRETEVDGKNIIIAQVKNIKERCPNLFLIPIRDDKGFTKTVLDMAEQLLQNEIRLSTLVSRCGIKKDDTPSFLEEIKERSGKSVKIINEAGGSVKITDVDNLNGAEYKGARITFLAT